MDWYPIFLDLHDSSALVVGGGAVALRKTNQLLQAGCEVEQVAPEIDPGFAKLISSARFIHRAEKFDAGMIAGHRVVIAATNDREVNQKVALAAKHAGVLVNVVDDPALSSFIMPAVVDRSPIVIAIGSNGSAPVLMRQVKADLEASLPQQLGSLANFMGEWRERVHARITDSVERRRLWESVAAGPIAEDVFAGRYDEANRALEQMLDSRSAGSRTGEVYIVGAGPGDPELLTLRALRLMQQCDVVLHDRLVSAEIVALVRRDAERIDVGKRCGQRTWSQERINQTLIDLARAGKRVLRLKGGDPLIFGRGGEELEALARAGIPYQVVPGISAALGCGAYAGIPLTHRDFAQSCVFVTAHGADEREFDWKHLAQPERTVVFYMALDRVETICRELRRHGLPDRMPAAVISCGTTRGQQVVSATLATLPDALNEHPVDSPALMIVGEVVSLHQRLKWFYPHRSMVFSGHPAPEEREDPGPSDAPAWLGSAIP
ncbi:MAG TPA: siroheme synthase CysG [Candidatus Binataceae bacterium]|nr:siroheme synthase CysG [Candidatus Binataceae bacterium]